MKLVLGLGLPARNRGAPQVAGGVPVNSVVPAISGTAREYEQLTATTGTWSNSPSSYSYQWKRGVTNVGTDSATYTVATADIGSTITVTVTATNAFGPGTPAVSAATAAVVAWTPAGVFGSALVALWDAEVGAQLTLVVSNVVTWTEGVNSAAPTQLTAGFQPLFNATGLNSRPAVVFDGTDDYLEVTAIPAAFPSGTNTSEIWVLADQQVVAGDATNRALFAYGGTSTSTYRGTQRPLSSTTFTAMDGTNIATSAAGVNTGIHVYRGTFGASGLSASIDGGTAGTNATMGSTSATGRMRFCARNSGAVTNFGKYAVNMVAILNATPSATDAANFLLYLKARGGLP